MKFLIGTLLLLCLLVSCKMISCEPIRKIGPMGMNEKDKRSPLEGTFVLSWRRLLASKDINDNNPSLSEIEGKLEKDREKHESSGVQEVGEGESVEIEGDLNEMETELMLPEETDDQKPKMMHGADKTLGIETTEEEVEQVREQQKELITEEDDVRKEEQNLQKKRKPKETKLKSELTEDRTETSKKERRDEIEAGENLGLKAENKLDTEDAFDQRGPENEVDSLIEEEKPENKPVVELQKEERESEKGKKGGKRKEKRNTKELLVEISKASYRETEDTAGQLKVDLESQLEGQKVETEAVSGEVGSKRGTTSDMTPKVVKKGGKKASDIKAELGEAKNDKDVVAAVLQNLPESKPRQAPRIPKKDITRVSQKGMEEEKPPKKKEGKDKVKVQMGDTDDRIKVKKPTSNDTMPKYATKAKKKGKKSLDSAESEKDRDNTAEGKLENNVGDTHREAQAELDNGITKEIPKKSKPRISQKEMKEKEKSKAKVQSMDWEKEVKDYGLDDKMLDTMMKAKKKGEQTSDWESESELVNIDRQDSKIEGTSKGKAEEPVDTGSHNAERQTKDVTKHNNQNTEHEEASQEIEGEEMSEIKVQVMDKEKDMKVSKEDGNMDAKKSDKMEGMVSTSFQGNDDEDDEYIDFMQDFAGFSFTIQDTAQKVAGHLGPNIQKITDTSKVYFKKANQQITESFSPLVGAQYAPFLASLVSYGLLLIPLAIVIILFEHIRALLSLKKVLLCVNIYLAAYFFTLLLATFIIGSEPMTFFYKNSTSGYIHLQLLQAFGYIIYLILQTIDIYISCSSETVFAKVTVTVQWLVAVMVGLHYYATVFHRAMAMKAPHTSWKIYGMYSIAFFILCLFARITRTKKGYTPSGDVNTNKKN